MDVPLNRIFFLFIYFSVSTFADCADVCPPPYVEKPATWKGQMRIKALKKLDQFLNWSTSAKLKTFALRDPLEEETFEVDIPEIRAFSLKYGYFSPSNPIVGNVTTDEMDIKLACCLLKAVFEKGDDLDYVELATAEILTKVLAYRDLKEGMRIQIPVVSAGKVIFPYFAVDHVFDLWHGMPAFGLVPEQRDVEPILLFRGTDFSFDSERGWASMMSDVDMAGPGLSAFQHSQKEIHAWLEQVAEQGKKTRTMGFSLGGALAGYTFIYENEGISSSGSSAFCPPGVAVKVIEDWQRLPEGRKRAFTTYVNQGDLVSKMGKLFGPVYAFLLNKHLKPLSAHTQLMCAEKFLIKARVDVQKENVGR